MLAPPAFMHRNVAIVGAEPYRYLYPSAVDNFRRQFDHLEAGGSGRPLGPNLGQATSLPRERVREFQHEAQRYLSGQVPPADTEPQSSCTATEESSQYQFAYIMHLQVVIGGFRAECRNIRPSSSCRHFLLLVPQQGGPGSVPTVAEHGPRPATPWQWTSSDPGVRNMTVRRPASCLPLASEGFTLPCAQLAVLPSGPSHQSLPSVREHCTANDRPRIAQRCRQASRETRDKCLLVTGRCWRMVTADHRWRRSRRACRWGPILGSTPFSRRCRTPARLPRRSHCLAICLPLSSRFLPGRADFLEVAAVVLTLVFCRYRHTQVAATQAMILGTWPGATATSEGGTARFSNRCCQQRMARGHA